MAKALDVANYLVYLSHSDGEPEPLSPLKLQKLLYYVQGLSLAQAGKPMFSDKIKAWIDGPVIPVVWRRFKQYASKGIPYSTENVDLSIDERVLIKQVWKVYAKYSGNALSELTHGEAPWMSAREGFAPDEKSDVEISVEALRAFFSAEKIALPDVPRPIEIRRNREVYRIEDAGKVLPTGF